MLKVIKAIVIIHYAKFSTLETVTPANLKKDTFLLSDDRRWCSGSTTSSGPIDRCCFYDFVRNILVALLEALWTRELLPLQVVAPKVLE